MTKILHFSQTFGAYHSLSFVRKNAHVYEFNVLEKGRLILNLPNYLTSELIINLTLPKEKEEKKDKFFTPSYLVSARQDIPEQKTKNLL